MGSGAVCPALGPGIIGFNPLGIPTLDPARHSKQARRRTGVRGGVPFGSLPQFARFTGPKKPHSCSDTVRRRKHFTRVPLGIQAFDTPESAVNPELRVRPSAVTAGVRGDCAMGPLRCRRWARGVRCEANVSLGIRPGDEQHADGKLSIGVGAGAEINGSSQNPRRQYAGYAANSSRT